MKNGPHKNKDYKYMNEQCMSKDSPLPVRKAAAIKKLKKYKK